MFPSTFHKLFITTSYERESKNAFQKRHHDLFIPKHMPSPVLQSPPKQKSSPEADKFHLNYDYTYKNRKLGFEPLTKRFPRSHKIELTLPVSFDFDVIPNPLVLCGCFYYFHNHRKVSFPSCLKSISSFVFRVQVLQLAWQRQWRAALNQWNSISFALPFPRFSFKGVFFLVSVSNVLQ